MEEKKLWYESKTKLGALLVGLGAVLGTVGGMINGGIDLSSGILILLTEFGLVLGVLGLRDLPFINTKK